jgi:hypothetical protein
VAGRRFVPPLIRLARILALVVHVERPIDAGDLVDHDDAAHRLGLTRAHLTQVAALTHLPIAVLEGILLGRVRATERGLCGRRAPTRARASRSTDAATANAGAPPRA